MSVRFERTADMLFTLILLSVCDSLTHIDTRNTESTALVDMTGTSIITSDT
jgi:hypothetical protein